MLIQIIMEPLLSKIASEEKKQILKLNSHVNQQFKDIHLLIIIKLTLTKYYNKRSKVSAKFYLPGQKLSIATKYARKIKTSILLQLLIKVADVSVGVPAST